MNIGSLGPKAKPSLSFLSDDDEIPAYRQKKNPSKGTVLKNEELKTMTLVRTTRNKANTPTCTTSNVHIRGSKQIKPLKSSSSVQYKTPDIDIDLGWHRILQPSFPPTLAEPIPWNSKITEPSFPLPDQTPVPKVCKGATVYGWHSISQPSFPPTLGPIPWNSKITEPSFPLPDPTPVAKVCRSKCVSVTKSSLHRSSESSNDNGTVSISQEEDIIMEIDDVIVDDDDDNEETKPAIITRASTGAEYSKRSVDLPSVSKSSPAKQISDPFLAIPQASQFPNNPSVSPAAEYVKRQLPRDSHNKLNPVKQVSNPNPEKKDDYSSVSPAAEYVKRQTSQVSNQCPLKQVCMASPEKKDEYSSSDVSPAAEYVKIRHVPQVSNSSPAKQVCNPSPVNQISSQTPTTQISGSKSPTPVQPVCGSIDRDEVSNQLRERNARRKAKSATEQQEKSPVDNLMETLQSEQGRKLQGAMFISLIVSILMVTK